MYETTVTEHPLFKIPSLDERGTPLAIDVRRVVATRISPAFNTGIAHVETGIGQIGAGYGRVPIECFDEAAKRLAAGRHYYLTDELQALVPFSHLTLAGPQGSDSDVLDPTRQDNKSDFQKQNLFLCRLRRLAIQQSAAYSGPGANTGRIERRLFEILLHAATV
jgi:hypothetical protein